MKFTQLVNLSFLVVQVAAERHGVRCAVENVQICHKGQTISVNQNSVAGHLGHGDYEGPCRDDTCCDPLTEPSPSGGSLPCRGEGYACCPDGTWSCSIGDGKTFPCGGELITEGFGKKCECDGVLAIPVDKCEEECFEYKDCDSCPNGYNDGCNMCGCSKDGTTICTQRYCLVQGIPFCTPDCSLVSCLRPECEGVEIVTPPGECCPVCQPSCSQGPCDGVLAIPVDKCEEECFENKDCDSCPNGYNDGCNDCECGKDGTPLCSKRACLVQGVPFCTPDCSLVDCARPVCDEGVEIVTPPGECCPVCQPSCSQGPCDGVLAIPVDKCEEECFENKDCKSCPNGYNDGCNDCGCSKDGTPVCTELACLVQGIPFCHPDCSTILCAKPECEGGVEPVTPPGECCPVCPASCPP